MWQPIDTAPTNDERILVIDGDGWLEIVSCLWFSEDEKPVWFNGEVTISGVTHWMPLPAPPEPEMVGVVDIGRV